MLENRKDYVYIVRDSFGWDRPFMFSGQWMHFAPVEKIKPLIPKVDELVMDGKIQMACYATKDPRYDLLPHISDSVLCVFSSKEQDPELKELVERELGVEFPKWKSQEDTIKDWSSNGKLYKQASQFAIGSKKSLLKWYNRVSQELGAIVRTKKVFARICDKISGFIDSLFG